MTVQIIEPGLVARTGHYFDYGLTIARALQGRGLQVRVHGQRGASPDVHAAMASAGVAFEASMPAALQQLPARGPGLDQAMQGWLQQTRGWLSAVARSAANPAQDLWLFPTLQAAGLLAVSLVPDTPRLVGLVHTPPLPGPWLQGCQRLLLASRPCRLLAIDPLVAQLAARCSAGLPVRAVAIPQGEWRRTTPADAIRRVGFFGHQRPERGKDLIAPLVNGLLARGLQVTLHDSTARAAGRVAVPGLEVVPGFVEDLVAWIARCDLVLCPMDRRRYSHRVSGIAAHALSTGVPLVLPAGTLIAERWRDCGSLRGYEGDAPEDILRAVDQVCANASTYAAAAQAAAAVWQREHGVQRFVDAVLAAD